jgi:intraflagellar transport protein 140
MLQAAGEWDEAINLAEKNDRINLKQTHYKLAKQMEALGEWSRAIEHYEASNTHRQEVPRMLFGNGRIHDLDKYIQSKNDPELLKWSANYQESNSDFTGALATYEKAGDYASQVRIF